MKHRKVFFFWWLKCANVKQWYNEFTHYTRGKWSHRKFIRLCSSRCENGFLLFQYMFVNKPVYMSIRKFFQFLLWHCAEFSEFQGLLTYKVHLTVLLNIIHHWANAYFSLETTHSFLKSVILNVSVQIYFNNCTFV